MAGTPYDLCLIDWKMPFIDGVETIRRIRRGAAGRRPAAVLMTAYDSTEIKEESRRAGLVHHHKASLRVVPGRPPGGDLRAGDGEDRDSQPVGDFREEDFWWWRTTS